MATNPELSQRRAERYAARNVPRFFKHFMDDTKLNEMMPQILEYFEGEEHRRKLRGEPVSPLPISREDIELGWQLLFGRWLAMSYALGFTDGNENREERRNNKKLKLVDELADPPDFPPDEIA